MCVCAWEYRMLANHWLYILSDEGEKNNDKKCGMSEEKNYKCVLDNDKEC